MLADPSEQNGLKYSLNDPRWGRDADEESSSPHNQNGRRPNEGPPDLDQLWRDFNLRLSRFFGSRGGDGPGFQPSGRNTGIGVVILLIIGVVLWLCSGFFTVNEGQVGLVTTFGKFSGRADPGMNWHWPNPFQDHEIVDVSRVRTAEVGYRSNIRNKQPREALMLTADDNILEVQFAVQYRVDDALAWIENNRAPEETVLETAEASARQIVGSRKLEDLLYGSKEQIGRDIEQSVQKLLDRYKLGVRIAGVTVESVQPPEQVQAAFDDAAKAAQDRDRQKNEAQAYANDVVPKAHGAAARLVQESEAYQARAVADAEGDTARFRQVLNEYQKAPGVTRDRMYIETMEQILSGTPKVLVDTHNGNNILSLPLDKLIAQKATTGEKAAEPHEPPKPNAAPADASSDVPATAPASTADAPARPGAMQLRESRMRESRDSRDREAR